MTTLTITAKGQITLKREVLEHLGLRPGSQVEVDLLPGGKVGIVPLPTLGAASWEGFWDALPVYDGPRVSHELEEVAIAAHLADDDQRIMREASERRAARRIDAG
jgi:AbrB family looped-hinge helix DNA binding protein